LQVLIPALLMTSAFFIVVIWLAVKAQLRKHYSGKESMIEGQGAAQTAIDGEGKVFFQGEYWTGVSDQFIPQGAKVRIKAVDGLKLIVEEIKKEKK
jgi:membrane-bound serine protease (ClpP class)